MENILNAEILLELKELLEKNNEPIIKQLNDIQNQIDKLNKINVVVKNGTTKNYSMEIQDAVQNLYNEIYEINHNSELTKDIDNIKKDIINIKKNMPDKFINWINKFNTKSSVLLQFGKIIFILLVIVSSISIILNKIGF